MTKKSTATAVALLSPVLLLCIKEIDWAVSALLSLSCLLCSTFLAVTAGESRQRCSAVSQQAGVKKSTGRVVDRKNKRAKGRKLKRGQRLRKGGQQWAQQRDSPVRLLWLQLLLNLTHMQGDTHTHAHTHIVRAADKVFLLSCCHSFTVTSSGGLQHENLLPVQPKHSKLIKIKATTQKIGS